MTPLRAFRWLAARLITRRTQRLCDPARLPGEPTGEQLRQLYGVPEVGDDTLAEFGDDADTVLARWAREGQ